MTPTTQSFAEFSLTDKLLAKLCEKNKKYGALGSFFVVHIGGSIGTVGAGVCDTLIQLSTAVLKFVTGIFISPFNLIRAPFTSDRYSEKWGWTMAISHLGHGFKHVFSIIPIFLETLLSGPEDVRKTFFKYNIEHEQKIEKKKQIAREHARNLKMKKDIALLKKQRQVRTHKPHPVPSPTSPHIVIPAVISNTPPSPQPAPLLVNPNAPLPPEPPPSLINPNVPPPPGPPPSLANLNAPSLPRPSPSIVPTPLNQEDILKVQLRETPRAPQMPKALSPEEKAWEARVRAIQGNDDDDSDDAYWDTPTVSQSTVES